MKRWMLKIGVFLLIALFPSFALAHFNHPELNWQIVETPHFLIHYHQNTKNFAHQSAQIAEELYEKLTSNIGYYPREKIPVVIENIDDKTGGYTTIFTNKIVIQAKSDPLRSSGNLSWLEEVLAHELTHYISFAAIDESIVPLRKMMAHLAIPMWFIEGLAQYLGEEWHSLKQMSVADQARENKIMSEGDLGAFYFFDGWGRMSGYYQSNSFVRYIFETYGRDKISEIHNNLGKQPLLRVVGVIDITGGAALYPIPRFVNFDQALRETLGKDTLQLYQEWRKWVMEKHKLKEDEIDFLLKKPAILLGNRAQSPTFSPDGNYIAFASNKDYDFAIFDLYLFHLSTEKIKKLVSGINTYFSFSPDATSIVYSKTDFYSPSRSFLSDLYQIDLSTGHTKRLTYAERAFQPVFSPEGDKILFVKKEGGNSNLYYLSLKTGKVSPLTFEDDGLTQNFSPAFSPDGESVVFVRFAENRRNLYILRMEDKKIHPLTEGDGDDRNPVFSPDGKRVLFISDRCSPQKINREVFNLWSLELETNRLTKHTQVDGGVFDPAISPDAGKIALSGYREEVFSIYIFPFDKIISQEFPLEDEFEDEKNEQQDHITEGQKEIIAEVAQEKEPVRTKTYPYSPSLKLHYIFPWFSISETESFFSLDFYASDVLEKHGLMGSLYLSRDTQYEFFYVNRSFEPTLWINMYHKEGRSTFKEKTFPVEITGQAAGVYYPLNNKISTQLTYFQEELKTHLFTRALEPVPWEGSIRALKGELGYSNLLPTRDSETLPRGKKLYLGVEYSDRQIGSDLNYLAWYAHLNNYFKLSDNTSFAVRLAGKRIETQDEPRPVFSLDGWRELRGYPQHFLDEAAGENLLLGSVEYRFRLQERMGGSSFFYLDSLGGALFFDAGVTWLEEENLKKKRIYKDAGFEFRLRMLPFGKYSSVLRFGMAWPFDYDNRGRFFIMLGGIF
ncbi:PD40 domain-containing protein [Candidatus Aerophobetes bacterium]|nr:PD40 domain-containing protein [Candidatus Aerophobetes bacterium]